jgi:hypothetical protein
MTRGQFSLARVYLRSALENAALVPLLVTSLVQLPAQTADAFYLWGQLRVWTLRKCLLCARALEDRLDYMSLCLSLLEPVSAQGDTSISAEFRSAIQKDVVTLAVQFASNPSDDNSSDATSPGQDSQVQGDSIIASATQKMGLPCNINVKAAKHFHCRMSMTPPDEDEDGAARRQRPASMQVSNSTKLIHDESFKVSGSESFSLCLASDLCNFLSVDSSREVRGRAVACGVPAGPQRLPRPLAS